MTTYSSKHCAFVDQEERWRKIVSLYQAGELSISTIARRFQITPQAVRDGLKKRNVLKLRRERSGNVGTAATANL
jgi:predicted HTH domain antitoxin